MATNSLAKIIIVLTISSVTVASGISPGYAQTPTTQPIVFAVLFWMDGCSHCHYVLEEVLPPIQAKYGDQLEIQLIELVGGEEVVALYQLAENRGIPKENVGVPLLVIGDHTLIGADQIPAELPGLIDVYLASGGVDWPEIPGLDATSPTATPLTLSTPGRSATGAVVEAVLFNTPDCYDCQLVVTQAITPAEERYGSQLHVTTMEIVTSEDVDYLYQVAAQFGLEQAQVDLPLLIVGGSILIGEQIVTELPKMMEKYLQAGGVSAPELPERVSSPPQTPTPVGDPDAPPSGFALAIAVIVVMLAVLIYCGVVFVGHARGSTSLWVFRSDRFEWLIPVLALAGLAVAAYLAYVETQAVRAICGPVGDCNAVQSSPYARLFGVLPVGVLGLIGYVLILIAWQFQRTTKGKSAAWAAMALFGMVYGGTLFSLYLTYLEPFVIRAVCAWCLSSAVIMTAILLLSLAPGTRSIDELRQIQFTQSEGKSK
jgi:uncharacterized membrane protein